jgi:hypothetical protein
MSLVNPINYQMFNGQMVPNSRPPMVEVQSDDVAYGMITINLPPLTSVTSLTEQVFIVVPPTTDEYLWIRQGSDLWTGHPTCLHATWLVNSENQVIITWEFDPSVLSATNLQYYSLEFFVNQTLSASVAQSSPKVIIKVKDFLE